MNHFQDLKALSSPKLHIVQLEVVNEESIANAAKKVSFTHDLMILHFSHLALIHNLTGLTHVLPLSI